MKEKKGLFGFLARPLWGLGVVLAAGVLAAGGYAENRAPKAAGGFLYSEYLESATALLDGDNGIAGSFVVETDRRLADFGAKTKRILHRETQRASARELLDYFVQDADLGVRWSERLERTGWEIADLAVHEAFLAATEGAKLSGFLRTAELDWKSELGGRRANVGVNLLGAVREKTDEAVAWQLRAFKGSGGSAGGNAGVIYRRAVGGVMTGANVFFDFETHDVDDFWRMSLGGEVRSEWIDLFANYYNGLTDGVEERVGNTVTYTYTADGYDVEANVHSPDIRWFTAAVSYYNFRGERGQADDSGFRYGVKLRPPQAQLALELYRDSGDGDGDGASFGGEVSWTHEFGRAHSAPGAASGFDPRAYFFVPVVREYSQRIRQTTYTVAVESGVQMELRFSGAGQIRVASTAGGEARVYSAADSPITIILPTEEEAGEERILDMVTELNGGKVTIEYTRLPSGMTGTLEVGSSIAFDGDELTLGYGNVSVRTPAEDNLMVVAPGAATISIAESSDVSVGYGTSVTPPSTDEPQSVTVELMAGVADVALTTELTLRVSTAGTELAVGVMTVAGETSLMVSVDGGNAGILETQMNEDGSEEAVVVLEIASSVYNFPAGKRWRVFDDSQQSFALATPEGLGLTGGTILTVRGMATGFDHLGEIDIIYDSSATAPDFAGGFFVGTLSLAADLTVATPNNYHIVRNEGRMDLQLVRVADTNSWQVSVSLVNPGQHEEYLQYVPIEDADSVYWGRFRVRMSGIDSTNIMCPALYQDAAGEHGGVALSSRLEDLFAVTDPSDWYLWNPAENDGEGDWVASDGVAAGNEPTYSYLFETLSDEEKTFRAYSGGRQFGSFAISRNDPNFKFIFYRQNVLVGGDIVVLSPDGPPTEGTNIDSVNASVYRVYQVNNERWTHNSAGERTLVELATADGVAVGGVAKCLAGGDRFHIAGGYRFFEGAGANGIPLRITHEPSYHAGEPIDHNSFRYELRANELPRGGLARVGGFRNLGERGAHGVGGYTMTIVGAHSELTLTEESFVSVLAASALPIRGNYFRVDFQNAAEMTLQGDGSYVVTLSLGDSGTFSADTRDITDFVYSITVVQAAPDVLSVTLAVDELNARFTVGIGGGTPMIEREPHDSYDLTFQQLQETEHYPHSYTTMSVSHSNAGFERGAGNSIVYYVNNPSSGLYTIVVRAEDDLPTDATDRTPVVLLTQVISVEAIAQTLATNVEYHDIWSTVPLSGEEAHIDLKSVDNGVSGHYEIVGESLFFEVDRDTGLLYFHGDGGVSPNTAYTFAVSITAHGLTVTRRYAVASGSEATTNICPIVYTRASGTYTDSALVDVNPVDLSNSIRYLVRHLFDDTGTENLAQYRRWRLYYDRSSAFGAAPGSFHTPDSTGNTLGRVAGPPNDSEREVFSPAILGKVLTLSPGVTVAVTPPNADNDSLDLSSPNVYRVYRTTDAENPDEPGGTWFLAVAKSGNDRYRCHNLGEGEFWITDAGRQTMDAMDAREFHPRPPNRGDSWPINTSPPETPTQTPPPDDGDGPPGGVNPDPASN